MYISEKREQWVADSTAYMDKVKQFYVDSNIYFDALYGAFKGRSLNYNNINLSHNGKYLLTSVLDDESMATYPAYIDLTDGKDSLVVMEEEESAYALMPADDGTYTLSKYTKGGANATYVGHIGQKGTIPFSEYIAQRDANAAAFLTQNYTFSVPTGDDEDWGGGRAATKQSTAQSTTGRNLRTLVAIKAPTTLSVTRTTDDESEGDTETEEVLATGSASSNADGSIFIGFLKEGFTDPDGWDTYHSYVLDLNKGAISSGVKAIEADDATAPVIGREYYSINGQRLGRLPLKGVYLEKVVTAKGVKTYKRVK